MYWVLYYIFILTCNKHLSFEYIEKYIENFNIKTKNLNNLLEEYDKCNNKTCHDNLIIEIKKKYKKIKMNINPDYNYDYILCKHIKIIKFILFLLYFIVKIMKKKYILKEIKEKNINDYNIIKNVFNIYKNNNIFLNISKRITNSNKLDIIISNKYFKRDNHKCHDIIFGNNICNYDDDIILVKKYKNLTNYEKEVCKNDVINGKIIHDSKKLNYEININNKIKKILKTNI
jgi:hypothetical protein